MENKHNDARAVAKRNREKILRETDIMEEISKWDWIFSALQDSKCEEIKDLSEEIKNFLPKKKKQYNKKSSIINVVFSNYQPLHDEWYYVCDDSKKRSVEVAFLLKDVDEKGTCACLNLKRVGTAATLTVAYGSYAKLLKSIRGAVKISGRKNTLPFEPSRQLQINSNTHCSLTDFDNKKKVGFYLTRTKDGESGKIRKVEQIQFDAVKKPRKASHVEGFERDERVEKVVKTPNGNQLVREENAPENLGKEIKK